MNIKIWYLCDGEKPDCKKNVLYRKICYREVGNRKHGVCRHTRDIQHAINFKQNHCGNFIEKETVEVKKMEEKDYKDILCRQLELLAEQSEHIKNEGMFEEERTRLLIDITHAMKSLCDAIDKPTENYLPSSHESKDSTDTSGLSALFFKPSPKK